MPIKPSQLRRLVKKCQANPAFFINRFCHIEHPKAGIIPFKLFDYQIKSINAYLSNRLNIYRKCRQCHRAGSMVWTPTGPVPIEKIEKGDLVYSLDDNDGLTICKVAEAFDNGISNDLVEIRSKTGHRGICTSDHEYKTYNGWVKASELTQNDRIVEVNNNLQLIEGDVKSVKPLDTDGRVYDLKVPPYDNYVVDGAVVHNCGISTLTGTFALWYGMFFKNKTILIVSKRDHDAKDYLKKNVKLVYSHLPDWMKEIWAVQSNEHEMSFQNGSKITSLTSSPETLRSNASSLNIIDEAAFMPHMDKMWAGGWPTLQHGGSVIVISTTNGVGNWYWRFWTDAEAKMNDFNPIVINWWDMTWKIEFYDELSKEDVVLAPTRHMRKCKTAEEIEKYGPYWSPWLEREYRNLTEKDNDSKFRQEVLADFIGTGNTVLSRQTINMIGNSVEQFGDDYKTVGAVDYVNPVTAERDTLDFRNDLWVWKSPVKPEFEETKNGKEEMVLPGHQYIMGCDTATGEGNDFSAIQVFDLNEGEQVAELKIKVRPKVFAKMIDYIGRWYNNATAVVENTGIGKATCQELYEDLSYPNMYRSRRKRADLKYKMGHLGFPTGGHNRQLLDKSLIDGLGEGGYTIYSSRFHKEAMIYVQLTPTKTGAEPGPGNNDDLILSAALALIAIGDVIKAGGQTLLPYHNINVPLANHISNDDMAKFGGRDLLMPMGFSSESSTGKQAVVQEEIQKFQSQIGGITVASKSKTKNNVETVKFKRNQLKVKKTRR